MFQDNLNVLLKDGRKPDETLEIDDPDCDGVYESVHHRRESDADT